jgi:hypothetical protein
MPIARAAFLSFVCALAVAIAGCGDAGSGEPLSRSESALTPVPALFANDKTACDYFVNKGLTNFQAAGIVGNLDQESGVDPSAVQYGGGPGRGIAQWSVGGRWDTDSNDNAVAYANQHGANVWSLQLQLDFIWYELTTFSGYGLAKLRQTTNITDATVVFETDFEGCGQCNQSQRVAYAQQVLPSCATAAAPYAAQFVSQSFPLASSPMTMVEGQVVSGYIELKNTGSKTWDSNTRLATTQPRDRKSAFADSTWVANNRPAAVKGTVAPGASYKFQFNLVAPQTTGSFDEFFGVVQEGTAWFSDSGQGGPPDNQLEIKIDVAAPEWRGTFKGQSFPMSPAPLTVHVGDTATGYIELTNTGTQTWKAGTTKLAPIPRDKPSPFADKSWLSPTRVSTVAADVAPGAVGRFDVALDASAASDTEVEFGLVDEGVAWFSDAPKGGGPADGFLKVHFVVVPQGAPLDAGVPASDAGSGAGGGDDGAPGNGGGGDNAGTPDSTATGSTGGCAIASRASDASAFALGVLVAIGALARRRFAR